MITKIKVAPHSGWVEFFEVQSQSDPTKAYIVARRENGAYGCDCPRWKFNRKKLNVAECKHIVEVKEFYASFPVSQNKVEIPVQEPKIITQNHLVTISARFANLEV